VRRDAALEADIYAKNLPSDQWNARWWRYVSDFQGVDPPSPRGEEFCDAATKTHINDNPAYYYITRSRPCLSFSARLHRAQNSASTAAIV